MITMGSYLEDYKNGIGFNVALGNFLKLNPKHSLALTIKKIRQTQEGLFSPQDTIEELIDFDYKLYEIEEQLIYLFNLLLLYIADGRIGGANNIYSVIKNISSSKLPPELQIIQIQSKCELLTVAGNRKQRSLEIEKCLQILGSNSGRYKIVLWVYLIDLCRVGNFKKLEEHLETLTLLHQDDKLQYRTEIILLLKKTEQGYFDNIKNSLDYIKSKTNFTGIEKDLTSLEKLYCIFQKAEYDNLNEESADDWNLLSCVYLFKNMPQRALYFAQKYAELIKNDRYESLFLNYCLIRAELANGNTNAAEYFLNTKQKLENDSLFDNFFWFRIHHIKKESKKAQSFFDTFAQYADTFDLHNRFDIELKLSPEISLTDIRNYSQNRKKNTVAITTSISINQKNNANSDDSVSSLIGKSQAILETKSLIKKYAMIPTTILIIGETGTGKELVAKALWQAGPHKSLPFIPINCGSISDHLLQSELFGHKKGAFTGAIIEHKGIFEEAKDGIVFLDEIGEISSQMQINLLRVLESGEYRPVGGNENKKIKCKIIAATNRNLKELVKIGVFREDLQYRLEKLIIEIPPLRDRSSDISTLIDYFLNELNQNLPSIHFDEKALAHLRTLPWQGNIRELRNEMERIRLFYSDKKILSISDLSEKYKNNPNIILKIQPDSKTSPLNLKSKFRKLNELKQIFKTHQQLSRSEVAVLLKVTANTAATYLDNLETENYIKKVKELNNTKTYYYELTENKTLSEKRNPL